ncbi:UNVERIFIED_CONTAM: hypothetical protein Slati_0092700 [Sesamum latifolium]|uniref:Zinc knuckle CX2CX4HX4C domain-containing protein n=1 Tax=Sesamum latifolium TaxID=2727402 RepID=A0AAW2Y8R3_9LAMI
MDDTGWNWGASLQIRVAINVNNPAEKSVENQDYHGDEITMFFTYERLPNFCYNRVHLGHIAKYCESNFAEEFLDPGIETPYGLWLRAPLPPRTRAKITTPSSSAINTQNKNPRAPGFRRGATVFGVFNQQEGGGAQAQGTSDDSIPLNVDLRKIDRDKHHYARCLFMK